MTIESHREVIYEDVKRGLNLLGYTGLLLRENYKFANVLATRLDVNKIPIATFYQDPPSYSNACFGVVISNEESGSQFVSKFRSLGAPQIFEITHDHLARWKILGKSLPECKEIINSNEIINYFEGKKTEWSPDNISRLKTPIENHESYQLDFADVGLLPLIDKQVQEKFDRLLTNIIKSSVDRKPLIKDDSQKLFRLMFKLIVAKILADRTQDILWTDNDPRVIIKNVENFYSSKDLVEPILEDQDIQDLIWDSIKRDFHFQNISVETLAYIYEDTLMTPELRRRTSTHGTPPPLAEYIVSHLPIKELAENERKVFEPFSGHAIFLVAALRRLRNLLSPNKDPSERHDYFVNMLSGLEYEPFALEIGKLLLILADYPNPNGWRLHLGDAFDNKLFDKNLTSANIVLCNPPFEKFTPEERGQYQNLISVYKPVEVLERVLKKPPQMLGFVLPQKFVDGNSYRNVRKQMGITYSSVEIISMPDNIFRHSQAPTVLLIASGKQQRDELKLTTGEVYKGDKELFYLTGIPSSSTSKLLITKPDPFIDSMWLRTLKEVWDYTSNLKLLENFAEIHRGIEYNIPLARHKNELISNETKSGFFAGLHSYEDGLEPYYISGHQYLKISEDLMRGKSYKKWPWKQPKVIANAHRIRRGHWRVIGAVDYEGLYCYQVLHGIWAKPNCDLSLEVISSLINSPLTNAFVSTLEADRSITVHTLKNIPIPIFTNMQKQNITSLVNEYQQCRKLWHQNEIGNDEADKKCLEILKSLDAEVLKAYDLPPRIERLLLNYFSGYERPVPFKFNRYYPEGFHPYVPWHTYISRDFQDANIEATLKRLKPINDMSITKMLYSLEDEPEVKE